MKLILIILIILSANTFAYTINNTSEVGQAMTGGNSKSRSLTGTSKSELDINSNKYLLEGMFFSQDTNGEVTAEKWNFKISYERKLTEKISAQLSHQVEADRFSGYNPRYNSDLGSVYYFHNDKVVVTSLTLAYRYTHENTTLGTVNTANKLLLAVFHKKQVNEKFYYETKAEYIPNLDESEAYIINANASIGFVMSSNFSVKIRYAGVYQDIPLVAGNERLDYTQTVTLVSKF
jgi:hypothetical protein